MKRIISILFVLMFVFVNLQVFADTSNETLNEISNQEKEESTEETDVITDDKSQNKLDNVKKSNTSKMIDYEPNRSGEERDLSSGIDRFTQNLREVFEIIKSLWQEFSLILTCIASAFSFIMFLVFKLLKVKSAQKGAMIMVVVPIVFFIAYNIIPAFLSTMI